MGEGTPGKKGDFYITIPYLCMASLLVMNGELIVSGVKKKDPVCSGNDCECTWNTTQCYDHFPAALVTGAV